MTASKTRVGAETPAPFVGREREQAEIAAALASAAEGARGRLFLIRGEPGVGKTRLVEEAAEDAESRGFEIGWGHGQDAPSAPAYWPWTQALRALRDRVGVASGTTLSSSREFLARILPEAGAAADALPPGAAESADARFRLFESVTSYLASLAERRPLMVVIEDLHAADVSSLLLVQFAARELRQSRVVLVGSYREPGPWLDDERRRILARTSGEGSMLSLRGLTEGEVSRLAEAHLGGAPPERFVRELHRATAGNALFVDGALRMLGRREKALADAFAGRAPLPVGGGVRESIREWVDYLSPRVREMVEAGSVLGEELAVDRLAALSGIALDEIDGLLEEARERGIVARARRSPMQARFRHGLIRETLYEDLAEARRRGLHRQIATILESGAHATDPAELAHHFLRAGEGKKAFTYAREAARASLERFAWEDAVAQLRDALAALGLDGDDPASRCEILLDLGGALSRAGDFAQARGVFAEAFGLGRSLDSTSMMARAAIGHSGPIGRSTNDPETAAMLREVLPRLREGDHDLRALVLGRLAQTMFLHGPESLARVPQALAAARRGTDPAVLAETLMVVWPMVINEPDSPQWTPVERAAATELLDLGTRHGNPEWQQWGRVYRFMEAIEEADLGAAEAEMRAVARTAAAFRQPFWLFGESVLGVVLLGISGRYDECLGLIDEGAHHGRGAPGIADAVSAFQRAFIGLELDRPGDLEPMIEFAAAYAEARLYPSILIHHLWEADRCEEATRRLRILATEGFSAFRHEYNWATAGSLLARICADLDERSWAAELYELLLPYANRVVRIGVPGYWALGPAARFLGMFATTAGRYDEAGRHFAVAREISRRMGARPWIAHTAYEEARLALRRGERESAETLVAEAGDVARELGMKKLLRRIAELPR